MSSERCHLCIYYQVRATRTYAQERAGTVVPARKGLRKPFGPFTGPTPTPRREAGVYHTPASLSLDVSNDLTSKPPGEGDMDVGVIADDLVERVVRVDEELPEDFEGLPGGLPLSDEVERPSVSVI